MHIERLDLLGRSPSVRVILRLGTLTIRAAAHRVSEVAGHEFVARVRNDDEAKALAAARHRGAEKPHLALLGERPELGERRQRAMR